MGLLYAIALSISSFLTLTTAFVGIFLIIALRSLYRVTLHPLSSIPGPALTSCTALWLHYHTWAGTQCTAIHNLHVKYGPIVRVAPNDVDIANGEALWPIYMDRGGFEKSTYYNNFDIDAHATIFSTLSLEKRATRAKAVLPIFSSAAISDAVPLIESCAEEMVERIRHERGSGKSVNILNIARSFAIDAVSAYVFQKPYGGLREQKLSASRFVDAFVEVSMFYYLPSSLSLLIVWLYGLAVPNLEAKRSMVVVEKFLRNMVNYNAQQMAEGKSDDSYAARLLRTGTTIPEAIAECKDVVFAGTDSTGNNFATICWFLAAHPKKYSKLKEELAQNKSSGAQLQSLPYLTGVIMEALRLSMAIACRLPRVVPESGWVYNDIHIPAGTNVGVAAYELHQNPAVFVQPSQFLPERWLNASPEMRRDWLPFGKGARSCVAKNLAIVELYIATEKLVTSCVLDGASPAASKIDSLEWFNAKVKGEKIELKWLKN